MPGPFNVSSAIHGIRTSNRGPFASGGNLYCFAFDGFQVISAYVSSDNGETWNQVGDTRTATSLTCSFGCCLSTDGQYIYVLYIADFPQRLQVSRFNLSLGDFDSDSSPGPVLESGAGSAPVSYIEQSADGTLVVMVKDFDPINGDSTIGLATLSSGLGSWSSLDYPSGQDVDGTLFLGAGLVRGGASNRVHGFAVRDTSGVYVLLHILAYGDGGSIGSDFVEITEIESDFENVSAAASGSLIAVAYNSADVGIGDPMAVSVAIASDEDEPTFVSTVVDDTSLGTEDGSQVELIGGESFKLVYWPAAGDVLCSRYSGSWSSPEAFFTPSDIILQLDGFDLDSGFGFFFADTDFSVENPFSFYFEVPGGATITGSVGIPSEEAFGKTHGVYGGGVPETCGAPVPLPPAVPCQQIPVTPEYPGDQDSCPTSGYSL